LSPEARHNFSGHPGSSIRTLDVGCGIRKYPGAVGIDLNPASAADVLCDLDRFPYPFADRTFDRLRAIHVIEHLTDVIRTMEEFHRLVRPGGRIRIETPHYTDYSSFCDPTHKHHLNSFSFRYFGDKHGGFGYYTEAKFREISVRVTLLAFWKWLGFQFLVNKSARFRKFWEFYLCYIIRGKAMEFEFEPIGPPVPLRRPTALPPSP
jgi:SAM-dependent methyltransferase